MEHHLEAGVDGEALTEKGSGSWRAVYERIQFTLETIDFLKWNKCRVM
jgi:hypothetical protein